MIRAAKFTDIPALTLFLQEAHARSHYAGTSVGVDIDEAKTILLRSIQRHGRVGINGCFVELVEHSGEICGLILGTLVRVYSIGDKLQVTDLFWITNNRAPPGSAFRLMRNMLEWAKSSPLIFDANCGVSAVIDGDGDAAGRILEMLGMRPYGRLYRMELQHEKAEAAE